MVKSLLLASLCAPLIPLWGQTIDHWEAPVVNTDSWKYIVPASEPDPAWKLEGFDDSGWNTGPGGIGYGDGDDNTIIPSTISLYMRRTFTITDLSKIGGALFEMDYDDGFIAYLNGVEIARANLGVPGTFIPYNQTTDGLHEAAMYSGGLPDVFSVDSSLLLEGENVLAITVHNQSIASSDLSSNAFLFFGITDASSFFGPTPAWFTPPFTSSNLPLVYINTGGADIPDEPKITASLGVIWNGDSAENTIFEPYNNYDGLMGIEIRGSSSQSFPKKSYSLELRDSMGMQINHSLLGLPADDDWILYGPYDDKTCIRDILTYYLGSRQGWYEPRFKYCELFLNDTYQGIYVLLEKIKIQKNRVNLHKLMPGDDAGQAVTGGYIVKIDRSDYASPVQDYFYSNYPGIGAPDEVIYVYSDPDVLDLSDPQKNYIEAYVDSFETVMHTPGYDDPVSGYRKYIDINSFVDYLIMNEMCRNVDAYRLSAYFYKNNDAYGGQLYAGPLWDYNLAWGNADYCSASYIPGFFTDCGTGPDWWQTLMSDTIFDNLLRCRWQQLRSGPFATDSILNWIDQQASLIGTAEVRNFNTWPIIGIYVWPNYYIGSSFEDEVNFLKTWITLRLEWMDDNMPGNPAACDVAGSYTIAISEINYHSDKYNDPKDWVELHNFGNAPIDLTGWKLKDATAVNSYTIPPGTTLDPENYLVLARYTDTFHMVYPTVANYIGPFTFGLNNKSESVRLYDNLGNLVREVDYFDSLPWPKAVDGYGPTLQIADELGDENDPSNWFAGCVLGSPGEGYTPCDYSPTVDEINYNSLPAFDPGDWVEIWNNSPNTIDLSNWHFRDSKRTHDFVIPPGTNIAPDGRLVLIDSIESFPFKFPSVSNYIGEFDFHLSANGDVVRLYDSNNIIRYSVRYNDKDPWPTDPDGNGYTLEMIDNSNPNIASNWVPGCLYGSPGVEFTVPCPAFAVDDIEAAGGLNVQPNPFSNDVLIHSAALVTGDFVISDMTGKTVAHMPSLTGQQGSYVHWNGRDGSGNPLPAGVYTVRAVTGNGSAESIQIVKMQ